MEHVKRTVTLRFRTTPQAEAAMKGCAAASGKSLSDWLRRLAIAELKRVKEAAKKTAVLPREKWCHSCGMRPDSAPTFNPDCECCNRLQKELRR